MKYKEIESEEALLQEVKKRSTHRKLAFQNLDFRAFYEQMTMHTFVDCLFMGCTVPEIFRLNGMKDCLEFPKMEVPFNAYPNQLYSPDALFENYQPGKPETYELTPDKIVYNHFMEKGKIADDIKESLARSLHDHSITDAMYDFLEQYDERKVVAIMGGHTASRDSLSYLNIVKISKQLTEDGYLMISGGGPGAMEATHVGAWLAGQALKDVEKVVNILSEAPLYNHPNWLDKAFEALALYPVSNYKSLGIPTWLYGHEPPTPFATHIAKYFDNSIREDGLLTIAKGGVIYTPGSAGTIQEIFQDATQNHYKVHGYASPMVFLDRKFWTNENPIYTLLKQMADEGTYKNMILSIGDTKEEIISGINQFTK